MKIKRGDTVIVISGKDIGKKGKVLTVLPKKNKVIVEGINMITKHQRATGPMQQGGIIEQESPMDISNVMYYCQRDKKGVRVGYKFLENGNKVRICKECKEELD